MSARLESNISINEQTIEQKKIIKLKIKKAHQKTQMKSEEKNTKQTKHN